jgi:NhaP-type Na+/H+ and K+/H+ antiporter
LVLPEAHRPRHSALRRLQLVPRPCVTLLFCDERSLRPKQRSQLCEADIPAVREAADDGRTATRRLPGSIVQDHLG